MPNKKNTDNVAIDKTLLIGTYNKGKLAEYQEGLRGIFKNIIIIDDSMNLDDVEETGTTFEENAILKAKYYAKKTNLITLSDDGGLVIPSLDGHPGLHSNRWMQEMGGQDAAFIELEKMLSGGKDPYAYMYLVVCIYDPATMSYNLFEAKKEGEICFKYKDEPGPFGFGYDRIFIPKGYDKPYSMLGKEVKMKVSHRALVIEQISKFYKTNKENNNNAA